MNTQPLACQLYERDGTVLATGRCDLDGPPVASTRFVMIVDAPGRVIERTLVGAVRLVCVQVGRILPLPAEVERIAFDRSRGRILQLRVTATPTP